MLQCLLQEPFSGNTQLVATLTPGCCMNYPQAATSSLAAHQCLQSHEAFCARLLACTVQAIRTKQFNDLFCTNCLDDACQQLSRCTATRRDSAARYGDKCAPKFAEQRQPWIQCKLGGASYTGDQEQQHPADAVHAYLSD